MTECTLSLSVFAVMVTVIILVQTADYVQLGMDNDVEAISWQNGVEVTNVTTVSVLSHEYSLFFQIIVAGWNIFVCIVDCLLCPLSKHLISVYVVVLQSHVGQLAVFFSQ